MFRCRIVNSYAELLALFVKMKELEQEGVIVIEQIKNRFLDLDSGYRDANCSIRFHGHVCELQLHLAAVIALKEMDHVFYEAARALGLAGPLPDAPLQGTWADASTARRAHTWAPRATFVCLTVLLVPLASTSTPPA